MLIRLRKIAEMWRRDARLYGEGRRNWRLARAAKIDKQADELEIELFGQLVN